MPKIRKNRTDNGRVVLGKKSKDEPVLAEKNWDLWVLCRDSLTSGDIQLLITIRKQRLKHEKDREEIRKVKNDIVLLEEAYLIIKRKERDLN